MTNPQSPHNHNESQSAHTGGRKLKAARVSQGISLDAVQEATKIPMDALKAIEEGYKVRTLSPFYLRGFMKIYAKYLGLDPNEIIAEIPKPAQDLEVSVTSRAEESASSQQRASLDDLQKESLGESFGKFFNPSLLKGLLIGLVVIVLAIAAIRLTVNGVKAVGQLFKSSSQGQKNKSRESSKTVKSKSKTKEQEPKQVQDAPREKSVAAPAVEADKAVQVQKQVMLTVRASKDSWFQVKVDGKLVFQSTMRAGRSESWTAKESLEVSGKNINQLEYEVNGRFIGALGRKDRQAKKLVITKDGMTVTQ